MIRLQRSSGNISCSWGEESSGARWFVLTRMSQGPPGVPGAHPVGGLPTCLPALGDQTRQSGSHNVDAPLCFPVAVSVVTPWARFQGKLSLKDVFSGELYTNPPLTSQFDLICLFTSSAPTYLSSSWFHSPSINLFFFFYTWGSPEWASPLTVTPEGKGEESPFRQESPGAFTSR